jgi:hypothetical protein
MNTLYREPSIDASYQVSVYLAKQFQRTRIFKNWLTRNSESVGDCYLMRIQQLFSYNISWRVQVNFQWDDDEFHFVLDQQA